MTLFRFRPLLALCAVAATLLFVVSDADARAGRGGSFGSRGSQTYSAPPSTATSQGARPIERSMTQPGQAGTNAARPSATPGGSFFNRPGFMGGGFLGGMFAGFLGAGLLGMLMGHGLTGGLGGAGSMIGLLLQIGIIAVVGYLLWTWWQRRSQSQPAMASGPGFSNYNSGSSVPPNSHASFGFGGGGGGAPAAEAQRPSGTDEVGLTPEDFNAFEKLLGEVEAAYSAEDLSKLRRLGTPELVSYLSDDLSDNASKGIVNKISDVKLLQGDLAEAWREGDKDYATVALRYGLNDQKLDRDSGRVLEGGPTEATETWTFMRAKGGHWLLSAIQQA